MIMNVPGVPDIVARINEELPPEIRLWGYVGLCYRHIFPCNGFSGSSAKFLQRTSVRFISAHSSFELMLNITIRICDSRKYTYFFPTYMLIPPKPGSGLHQTLGRYVDSLVPATDESVHNKAHSFWADLDFPSKESELAKKRAWRVEPAQMEQLRAIARKFEGTHNFHNFTVARDFNDRSNQRHMKEIEVSNPSRNHFFVRSRCVL